MSWGRGSTRASRALRAATLAAWPICYLQYDGCTQVSTRDDHVTPLAEGGSDHPSNHRGACESCHDRKSATERARGRARAHAQRNQSEPHPGVIPPGA
jgi:5-methylcytosine-specific restriction enzyme A